MSKVLVISTAICASLFTLNVYAQTKKVQGTVVDSDQKKGLMGVSVTALGAGVIFNASVCSAQDARWVQ